VKTAVLIAAHNEELAIFNALKSIGRNAEVFVASDNSSDKTAIIARRFTPHVLELRRGGKGRAIRALISHYGIVHNFDAFIILDADTMVSPKTITEFESALGPGVAGAVGRLDVGNRSLMSHWRAIQHYMTAKMYRKGMAAINCIHIMSGTCAIWSTSAFMHIKWHDTPTEDMDWTYQIHRLKLGRIAFAPEAVVYTQEPICFKDYARQMLRWLRGYWATTARYNAPFGGQSLDFGQALFMLEIAVNWARLLAVPLVLMGLGTKIILWSFLYDAVIILAFAIAASIQTRNWRVIAYLPGIIWFYLFDMMLNITAIMTYRKLKSGVWKSPERGMQHV
jgi:biofilm PGA synthesis N-glycosyltransferase PgaC